uniref:Uncharacterized protein n=1 Tax=Anguilla anguilla TaxID=7936 RepID=A0A0E9TYW0_ANGAN
MCVGGCAYEIRGFNTEARSETMKWRSIQLPFYFKWNHSFSQNPLGMEKYLCDSD